MQRIPQRPDRTRVVILSALLVAAPLLAREPAAAIRASSDGVIALAAVAPASASTTNAAATSATHSNIPMPARSHTRTKAGVLAAGTLIAITILIVACGVALLSSFKQR